MTPQHQRIALAEWAGFTFKNGYPQVAPGDIPVVAVVPNYLNDLNAVHELEKKMTDSQWSVYVILLATITEGKSVHATSAQRCEALLRTLGLWKEDK